MAVVVHIPGYLRTWTAGDGQVAIDGAPATVRDALGALWANHPGVRDRIVDEQGRVRPHVNVFVGTESIRFLEGLDTPLPESCDLTIVPAVSGGGPAAIGSAPENSRRFASKE